MTSQINPTGGFIGWLQNTARDIGAGFGLGKPQIAARPFQSKPKSSGGGSAGPPGAYGVLGQAAQQGAFGPASGGLGYEAEMSEYLQRMFGYDKQIADYLASRGGGGGGGGFGGGGGGGGGGGIGGINTAARDAALANLAGIYGSASATFDGSPEEYKKIHAQERGVGAGSTESAQAGADQAAAAADASRAQQRKVLGIEDAAAVVSDTIATEKAIAGENIQRNDDRMETRAQGHLDNNLKFNTDLKATVELEGKEKQKQITDYYAGQLASIAARSGGGRGSSGGSRSSGGSSKGMTAGQMWNGARDLQGDDLRRLDAMHGPGYRQGILNNYAKANPDMSYSQQLSGSKWITGSGPYKK